MENKNSAFLFLIIDTFGMDDAIRISYVWISCDGWRTRHKNFLSYDE